MKAIVQDRYGSPDALKLASVMELGHATALTVPIVILTTDFITHGRTDDGRELVFPDPLIETLANATPARSPRPSTSPSNGCPTSPLAARTGRQQHHIQRGPDSFLPTISVLGRPVLDLGAAQAGHP